MSGLERENDAREDAESLSTLPDSSFDEMESEIELFSLRPKTGTMTKEQQEIADLEWRAFMQQGMQADKEESTVFVDSCESGPSLPLTTFQLSETSMPLLNKPKNSSSSSSAPALRSANDRASPSKSPQKSPQKKTTEKDLTIEFVVEEAKRSAQMNFEKSRCPSLLKAPTTDNILKSVTQNLGSTEKPKQTTQKETLQIFVSLDSQEHDDLAPLQKEKSPTVSPRSNPEIRRFSDFLIDKNTLVPRPSVPEKEPAVSPKRTPAPVQPNPPLVNLLPPSAPLSSMDFYSDIFSDIDYDLEDKPAAPKILPAVDLDREFTPEKVDDLWAFPLPSSPNLEATPLDPSLSTPADPRSPTQQLAQEEEQEEEEQEEQVEVPSQKQPEDSQINEPQIVEKSPDVSPSVSPKRTRLLPDSFDIISPPPSRKSKSTTKKVRRRPDDLETSPSRLPASVGQKRPRPSPKDTASPPSPSKVSPATKKKHFIKDEDDSDSVEEEETNTGELSKSSFDLFVSHKQLSKSLKPKKTTRSRKGMSDDDEDESEEEESEEQQEGEEEEEESEEVHEDEIMERVSAIKKVPGSRNRSLASDSSISSSSSQRRRDEEDDSQSQSPSQSKMSPSPRKKKLIASPSEKPSLYKLFGVDLSKKLLNRSHNASLFKGFTFFLTGMPEISKTVLLPKDTVSNQIKRLIMMHGGKVETTFSPSTHHPVPHKTHKRFMNCITISNQMHRTLKYLMAIVHGNPIVNFQWIILCCQQRSLISYEKYRLASGFSIEDQTPVIVRDTSFPPNVFDDLRCEVSGSASFKEDWGQVLRAAGAKVVSRIGSAWEKCGSSVQVIISEPDPSQFVMLRADELGIPILSVEWAIQCLLDRTVLPYDRITNKRYAVLPLGESDDEIENVSASQQEQD